MGIAQLKQKPDLQEMLMQAYDISDMIKKSELIHQYKYWNQAVQADPEVQQLVKQFHAKRELFEECQRFGHYHPNYHEAMNEVYKVQEKLDEIECVRRFKQAENELDQLLYTISETLARAVSEDIKVPSNNPLPSSSGGCGAGGSCNCG